MAKHNDNLFYGIKELFLPSGNNLLQFGEIVWLLIYIQKSTSQLHFVLTRGKI